jgi:hypothetical protein
MSEGNNRYSIQDALRTRYTVQADSDVSANESDIIY